MDLFEKIVALEEDAAAFGFEWETAEQIMAQIQSECIEIKEHINENLVTNPLELQNEIGDLLHAAFSLCVFCKLDPQTTVKQTLNKFERRLNAVKSITHKMGLTTLKGYPFGELMQIWKKAKEQVG